MSDDLLSETDRGLPMLCRDDLAEERIVHALRSVFRKGRLAPLSKRERDHARAVVNPEVILARQRVEALPLFKEPETAPEDVVRVMDREQERVAEHLGFGYRWLRGVAGSGKTLMLVHRARHLRGLWPQCRILLVCYNRTLAAALEAEIDTDEDDDSLLVINIDKLARKLSMERPHNNKEPSANRNRCSPPDFDQNALDALETR